MYVITTLECDNLQGSVTTVFSVVSLAILKGLSRLVS
jgi:hypothetical protein